MADRITYVGLDVHKESIVVAVAEGGLRGEVREYGRIANTPTALGPFAAQARRRRREPAVLLRGGADRLRACTGILGTQMGIECTVAAPTSIPTKRGGDRVKTHRRDARKSGAG